MFARRKKSVLLIDFDNVERVGANLTRKIGNWVAWIERGGFDAEGVRRELLVKKVYWNSQHDRHRVPFERAGFEVVVCQAWRSAKGSSVDFELTIDAIDYANSLKRLQEVIILSFDTDFLSVVHRLQQKEIEAVLMVTDQPISDVYRDRANHVISDAQLRTAFDYTPPVRRLFGSKKQRGPSDIARSTTVPAPPQADAFARSAPQRPGQSTPPHTRNFDIEDAVQRLQRAAAQTPGRPLSRRVVCDLLREVRGFYMTAPHQWLGNNTYYDMLETLARRSGGNLQVVRLKGGGRAIAHRAPKPQTP